MKKHFVTGLAILLPATITFLIVLFLFNLLTKPFVGFVSHLLNSSHLLHKPFFFLSGDQVLMYSSQLLSFVTITALIFILGATTQFFFVRGVLSLSDYIFHRIPFVNKIYKAIQDVVQTLFGKEHDEFASVVLAPFPNNKTMSIGFVTRASMMPGEDGTNRAFVSVFIPGTPNPTIGFLILFDKKSLIFLDMTVEEALKTVVSCGIMLSRFSPSQRS